MDTIASHEKGTFPCTSLAPFLHLYFVNNRAAFSFLDVDPVKRENIPRLTTLLSSLGSNEFDEDEDDEGFIDILLGFLKFLIFPFPPVHVLRWAPSP